MKNVILYLLLIFTFIGCSTKTNMKEGIISTSTPVFINSPAKDNKVYVNFTNTSNVDSNLTEALKANLTQNGYQVVNDQKLTSTAIKGNLNYFRRVYIKDSDPFMSVGFGSGGWGSGVGIGWAYRGDYYDNRTNSYLYDAQLSLQIRVNDGRKIESYETNLNYQSSKNINSLSTMMDIFNYKISNQILHYLKNYQ